jgi:hypothetical protein
LWKSLCEYYDEDLTIQRIFSDAVNKITADYSLPTIPIQGEQYSGTMYKLAGGGLGRMSMFLGVTLLKPAPTTYF